MAASASLAGVDGGAASKRRSAPLGCGRTESNHSSIIRGCADALFGVLHRQRRRHPRHRPSSANSATRSRMAACGSIRASMPRPCVKLVKPGDSLFSTDVRSAVRSATHAGGGCLQERCRPARLLRTLPPHAGPREIPDEPASRSSKIKSERPHDHRHGSSALAPDAVAAHPCIPAASPVPDRRPPAGLALILPARAASSSASLAHQQMDLTVITQTASSATPGRSRPGAPATTRRTAPISDLAARHRPSLQDL